MQIELEYTFPETWEVVRLTHICRLMDGEKKEGDHVCLDAKYLRGKSSGEILPKGKFVSTGDNIILVDGENSGEVFAKTYSSIVSSSLVKRKPKLNAAAFPHLLTNVNVGKIWKLPLYILVRRT